MIRRRALMALALATAFFVVQALPAQAAESVRKSKTYSVNGRTGKAAWKQDKDGGKVTNWVTVSAEDSDGPGGKCTETWWDYSTKPHQHFNPGVLINCSGGTKTVSRAHVTSYHGIAGMGVIVCEVPDTSGPITRNSKNCRGNIGSMYLRSGQRYSRFGVKAIAHPSGVTLYR